MNSRTSGFNNARPRDIRDSWGSKKALGYLIGEKLLNYIRASDSDPSWAAKLPLFTAEIERIFMSEELRTYFATTTRVGPAAHVGSEEQYQMMRDAGAFGDGAVSGAADALLFERARVLLLSGGASGERL
jgi:hypothetical protein